MKSVLLREYSLRTEDRRNRHSQLTLTARTGITMWHPFDVAPIRWRIILLVAFGAFGAFLFWQMQCLDAEIRKTTGDQRSLHSPTGELRSERDGVLEFQLAFSVGRAKDIRNSWKQAGVLHTARKSLRWDFGFILCYVLVFSRISSWVACCFHAQMEEQQHPIASRVACVFLFCASLFSLGQFAGGLLDVVENCSLLYMLEKGVSNPWPQIAALAACTKFVLVLLAIVVSGPAFVVSILVSACLRFAAQLKTRNRAADESR